MDENSFKLFLIKANRLLFSEVFSMDKIVSGEFLMRTEKLFSSYFADSTLKNGLSLTHEDVDQAQIIYSYLLGKRDRILCFWIPSNWLTDSRERLTAGIAGIAGKIKAKLV